MRLNICPKVSLVIFALVVSQCAALSSPPDREHNSTATLTEAHGDVYKRGFKDASKQLWDDPVRASAGDRLTEGMQVGTGNKSWAELTWSYITARVWSNSVYAIAPNSRLVYLTSGEMLYHLDKNRRDKNPYYVWTNLLQARVRGTTILFQATKVSSRVTVLEGSIDVTNRLDHSVVHLNPGLIYEITQKGGHTTSSTTKIDKPAADKEKDDRNQNNSNPEKSTLSTPTALLPDTTTPFTGGIELNHDASSLFNVANVSTNVISVFETEKQLTTVQLIDPEKILSLPLLQGFETPLSSLPLVQTTMGALESDISKLGTTIAPISEAKLLGQTISLIKPPMTVAYKLGGNFTLPPVALQFFPPDGIIGQPSPQQLASGIRERAPGHLAVGGELPNGAGTGLFSASLPFAGSGAGTGAVPGLSSSGPVVIFTNGSGGSILSGASLPVVLGPNGVLTTTSGGLVNTLTSTTSSLTGTSGALLNTLTGTVNHTVNTVTTLLHL